MHAGVSSTRGRAVRYEGSAGGMVVTRFSNFCNGTPLKLANHFFPDSEFPDEFPDRSPAAVSSECAARTGNEAFVTNLIVVTHRKTARDDAA